jgi:hypothetical protein
VRLDASILQTLEGHAKHRAAQLRQAIAVMDSDILSFRCQIARREQEKQRYQQELTKVLRALEIASHCANQAATGASMMVDRSWPRATE